MRKKMLLALGFLFIAGSAIGLSSASRLQYHLYKYPYNTPSSYSVYKPHSERITPWQNSRRSNRYSKCTGCREHLTSLYNYKKARAYKNSRYNRNNGRYLSRAERLAAYRARKTKENARYANTYQTKRLIVRNGQYNTIGTDYLGPKTARKTMQQASDSNFAIETGTFKKDSNNVFRANGTTLAYQITQTPKSYKCSTTNFWNCANNLNKTFKSHQSFSQVYEKDIDFRWNQTNGLDFAYFPTVTENFEATAGGTRNSYFLFNALNPKDGSIIQIAGVSNVKEKERAAQLMYKIFETFRFKKA